MLGNLPLLIKYGPYRGDQLPPHPHNSLSEGCGVFSELAGPLVTVPSLVHVVEQ